jgi:hypothetical protein
LLEQFLRVVPRLETALHQQIGSGQNQSIANFLMHTKNFITANPKYQLIEELCRCASHGRILMRCSAECKNHDALAGMEGIAHHLQRYKEIEFLNKDKRSHGCASLTLGGVSS